VHKQEAKRQDGGQGQGLLLPWDCLPSSCFECDFPYCLRPERLPVSAAGRGRRRRRDTSEAGERRGVCALRLSPRLPFRHLSGDEEEVIDLVPPCLSLFAPRGGGDHPLSLARKERGGRGGCPCRSSFVLAFLLCPSIPITSACPSLLFALRSPESNRSPPHPPPALRSNADLKGIAPTRASHCSNYHPLSQSDQRYCLGLFEVLLLS
jgi:hypothetical protein